MPLLRREGRRDRAVARLRGASQALRPRRLARGIRGLHVRPQESKGVHFERWRHTYGCGKWFLAARCTATLEVFGTYPAQVSEPPPTSSRRSRPVVPTGSLTGRSPNEHASCQGRPVDQRTSRSNSPSTASGARLSRRHPGCWPSGQRSGAGRSQLQVSPPARHRRLGAGRTERSGQPRLWRAGWSRTSAPRRPSFSTVWNAPARTTGRRWSLTWAW